MDKMNGESINIERENIEKLKEVFPEVFTEGKIDFEKLQLVLGEDIEENEERYNFTWHGKRDAIRLSQTPTTGTLRPDKENSKNWDETENLYIEGDNLEVLKLLQKSYHSKIKMIYIDPPYNTGKDFVYKDNYRDNMKNYLEFTEQIDEEGHKLSTNTDTSGRYHTDWLNMMYPRLRLARNLLTEDGFIFISIDDNEFVNVKKICDEIFGEENFVDNIIWKKRYGGGAKEKHLVTLHEYIIMYAKNINEVDNIFVPLSEESIKRYYKRKDENFELRGGYRTHPLEAGKAMDDRENLIYPIPAPDGSEIWPTRQWLWSKERTYEALKNGELEIQKNENNEWIVSSKQYLKDENGEIRRTKFFSIIEDVYTQHGTNEIIKILGDARIMSYPKPSALIKKLLLLKADKDAIILDFFAGSSTTAHAVMDLNAEDEGNRKFIMVQLPEPTGNKSEAFKAGYKTIADIGRDRIRRAGSKILQDNKDKEGIEDLDIGFKSFKLDTSNLKEWNPEYMGVDFTMEELVNNFVPGREQEDILYEILIKYGIDLSTPIEVHKVNDKTVYNIGMGSVYICLDNDIDNDVVEEILRLHEEYKMPNPIVVFKDIGFENDEIKLNAKLTLNDNGIEEVVSI